MDVATLALLMLPPAMRLQPELLFTWWGVSGHPSNLNPFLRIALADFLQSLTDFDAKHEGTQRTHRVHVTHCPRLAPRLLLVLASCDCPAQRSVSGQRGPGAVLGCEKCHSFAWRDPAYEASRADPRSLVQEV